MGTRTRRGQKAVRGGGNACRIMSGSSRGIPARRLCVVICCLNIPSAVAVTVPSAETSSVGSLRSQVGPKQSRDERPCGASGAVYGHSSIERRGMVLAVRPGALQLSGSGHGCYLLDAKS